MPGESSPAFRLEIFNTEDFSRREIDMEKYTDQMLFICPRDYKHSHGYDRPRRSVWQGDNESFYVLRQSRDIQRVDLCRVDVATGECREVVHEEMETSIEYRYPVLVNGGKELLQWSERTGWAHLYRYSTDGKLLGQITKGEWHVSDILGVDDARRVIYFTDRMGWGEILGPEAPYHDEHFCFGFTLLGKNTLYPAHYHPATELYVVLSGLAVWTLDGVSKVRGPGEFILHPSNHVHSMQTKDEPLLALSPRRQSAT